MPQYPNFVGLSKYKGSWSATNNIAVTSDATPLTIEGLYGEGRRNTWGPGSNISGSGGYSLSASCTSNLTGGLANLTAAAGDFWKVTDAANRTLGASTEWAEGDYILYTSGSEWIRLYSGDVQSSIIIGNMSSGSLSNTLLTASSGGGILFHYYNDATSSFSGSHQFTFNPDGPNVELTGNMIVAGDLFVTGTIKGNKFSVTTVVENVSNIHVSGATKFGNTTDDIHQYTGSLDITGSYDSSTNHVPILTVKGDGLYGKQIYDIQQFEGPIKVTAEGRDNYIHLESDDASDSTDAFIWCKDAVGLALGGNNTTPIVTVQVGTEKVGIGTTAPQSHLHVTGTISGSAGYFTGDVGASGSLSAAGSIASSQTVSATNTIIGTDGDFTGNVKVSGSATALNLSASNLDLATGMSLSGTIMFASSSNFTISGAHIDAYRVNTNQLVVTGGIPECIILNVTGTGVGGAARRIILNGNATGSYLGSTYTNTYRTIELFNRGASVIKSWEYGASGRWVDYNADKYDQMFQWYGTSTGSFADWRWDPGASGIPYWTFARNQVGGVSIGSSDIPKTRLWVSGNLSASSGLYTGDITASGTITSPVVSASFGYLASTLSVSGTITGGATIRAINTLTGTDAYLLGDADVSGTMTAGSVAAGGSITATNTLIGQDGYFTANVDVSGTLTAPHLSASNISVSQGGVNASGSIYSGLNLTTANTVSGSDGYYTGLMHVSGNAKFGAADTNVFIASQLTGNVGMSGTLGQFATLQVGGANIGSGSTPWQHDGGAIFYTNGNVGASTDDPQNPLHVSGTAFFSGSLLGGQDPIKIAGLRTGSFAGEGSYLGVDSDGKVVLNHLAHATASGGAVTALNNKAANRLVTIGSTTTELDGEANASFDGSTLNITGTFRANTIAGVTQVTAVTQLTASEMSSSVLTINQGGLTIDGTAVSSTAGELNILDGVTATASEINFNDVAAGVATANKSLVLNSGKEIGIITALSGTTLSGTTILVNAGGFKVDNVAVTATAAELNIIDGVTATTAEVNVLDGATAGVGTANKALVLTAGKTIGSITALSGATIAATTALSGASATINAGGLKIDNVAVTATANELNIIDGVTATTAEVNVVSGVTPGVAAGSKALVLSSGKEIGDITALSGTLFRATTISGSNIYTTGKVRASGTISSPTMAVTTLLTASAIQVNAGGITMDGTAISATAAEVNVLDGATAGVGTANKALVLTAGKTLGDITALSGTLIEATTLSGSNLQISQGNAFISGTLTVGGGLNLDSFADDITFASVNNIFSYNLWKSNASGGTMVQNTGGKLTLSGSGGVFIDPTAGQAVTINDAGEAADLRVESDGEAHMLFVDGSENRAFIGNSVDGLAPSGTLEITNHASAGAYNVPLLQLNNNDTDQITLDINAANIDADVIDIVADAVTTANVIDITADGLTSGKALNIVSDSSDTTAREVAYIANSNASSEASTLRLYNRTTFPALVCQGRITTGLGSTSSNNTAGQTISAAQLIHGAWAAAGRNASQDDTTPTAAQIVAAIPNCAVGDSFEFIFLNVSGNAVDLVGGTGVLNLSGGASSFAVAAGKGRKFRFRVSNAAGGSEAVTVWAETDDFAHSS